MRSKKVHIGKSKLHGKGVIALKDIKKGERVFLVQGPKKKFLIDNQKKADAISYNIIGIGKNRWVHPTTYGRYLNHSCDPNTFFKGQASIVALKDIKEGEEVTLDYSLNEADIFWNFRCGCGAKNCRGHVRSIQFLPKKLVEKRGNLLHPYFKRVFRDFNQSKFKSKKDLEKHWIDFIRYRFSV